LRQAETGKKHWRRTWRRVNGTWCLLYNTGLASQMTVANIINGV